MNVEREKLIRVTDEAQLRVGLLIEEADGDRRFRYLLLNVRPRDGNEHADGHPCYGSKEWETTDDYPDEVTCFCTAIPDGLVSIVDTGLESDTPTEAKQPAPRRLERTR